MSFGGRTLSEADRGHGEVYNATLFKMVVDDVVDRILRAVWSGRGRLCLGQAAMID